MNVVSQEKLNLLRALLHYMAGYRDISPQREHHREAAEFWEVALLEKGRELELSDDFIEAEEIRAKLDELDARIVAIRARDELASPKKAAAELAPTGKGL